MKEDLIDSEGGHVEKLIVEDNSAASSGKFKPNECPFKLKENNFTKLKSEYQLGIFEEEKNKNFVKCDCSNVYDTRNIISTLLIFILPFYTFTFYMLFITIILTGDTKALIFFFILYAIGILSQVFIMPNPEYIKTKTEFESDLKKYIDSSILLNISNGKKKNKKEATYQCQYTVDITGNVNIPISFNYASIEGIQLYSKKDFNDLVKDFKMLYKNYEVQAKVFNNGEEFDFTPKIYSLTSNTEEYTISLSKTILAYLFLYPIYALYALFSSSKQSVRIYLAKILTKDIVFSESKFTVHGASYYMPQYTRNELPSNDVFEHDMAEHKKKLEEEAERKKKMKEEKRERRKNTQVLSTFENYPNFKIVVKKVYDYVKLTLTVHEPNRNYSYKDSLGIYDPNCQERKEHSNRLTVYYPKGHNTRIEFQRGVYDYNITIGDEYSKTFSYK